MARQKSNTVIRKLDRATTKKQNKNAKSSQRLAKSATGRCLAKIVIKNVLNLYKKGARKIKNEKIRRALSCNLANTDLDYEQVHAYDNLG